MANSKNVAKFIYEEVIIERGVCEVNIILKKQLSLIFENEIYLSFI
jgi:hypothetical protein